MVQPDRDREPPLPTDLRRKDPLVPGFRELPPVPYWAGSISVPEDRTEELLQILGNVSRETNFTFRGFLTNINGRTIYTFTRYPRHHRGIRSIEDCNNALTALTQQEVTLEQDPQLESGDFRVVFGRREGYERDNQVYPVDKIRGELPDVTITEAHIYVVGPEKPEPYQEPAAVITGERRHLRDVYRLAANLRQERFTVEDLQQRTAYVVEPPGCKTPDPEPEITSTD